MDIAPFVSMDAEAYSQIFETDDGTLIASFRGHLLSQAEMDSGITSNGVIRPRDGGLRWGDASPITRAAPGSGLWFNESTEHDRARFCFQVTVCAVASPVNRSY